MFSGTVVCIRTPVKDLLVGAMSGMGLSFSELCCLFCCPPCPSRIAAKLAFLPPEPTYAFEEENSTDNAAATTAEPSKCKRSPVATLVYVPPYLRPLDSLCWCCQWRVLCQIVLSPRCYGTMYSALARPRFYARNIPMFLSYLGLEVLQ